MREPRACVARGAMSHRVRPFLAALSRSRATDTVTRRVRSSVEEHNSKVARSRYADSLIGNTCCGDKRKMSSRRKQNPRDG